MERAVLRIFSGRTMLARRIYLAVGYPSVMNMKGVAGLQRYIILCHRDGIGSLDKRFRYVEGSKGSSLSLRVSMLDIY